MPVSFSEVPFLRILLLWIAGTMTYVYGMGLENLLSASAILVLSILLMVSLKWVELRIAAGLGLLVAVAIVGHLRSHQLDSLQMTNHFSNQAACKKEMIFTGKIREIRQGSHSITAVVEVQNASCPDRVTNVSSRVGNVLLSVANAPNADELIPGRTIQFKSGYTPIRENGNPRGFSYKNHMAKKRVYHRARIAYDEIVFPEQNILNMRERINRFRAAFITHLKDYTNRETSPGMITGIVLGDRSLLDEDINRAFRDVGAAHVLAVSGLHVGIVFSIFYFFLSRLNKYLKTMLILLAVWGFVIFAGAPPSAVRAGSMFTLFSVGQLSGKRAHSINILAFCAVLHLFIEPNLMRDVGFQFSYLALGGIIVFFNKINSLIPCPIRILNPLKDLVSLSIAAQLGVLPLSIYYFNQASPYFMLSSIFSVFGAYIILSGGLLLGLMGFISAPAAKIIGWVMDYSCDILAKIMLGFTQLPFAAAKEIYLSPPGLLSIYALIILTAFIVYHRIRNWHKPFALTIGILFLTGFTCKLDSHSASHVYIYSTGREVLIDVFSPGKLKTIKSQDLSKSAENFAADGNRIYYRSKSRLRTTVTLSTLPSARLIRGEDTDVLIMTNGIVLPEAFHSSRPLHLVIAGLSGITREEKEILVSVNPVSICSAAGNSLRVSRQLEEVAQSRGIEFINTFNHYHLIKIF